MAQLTAACATCAANLPEESLRSFRTAMTILYSKGITRQTIRRDARLNSFPAFLPSMFEVIARDGLARVGRLSTAHGMLETPALLPVINPRLRSISAAEIFHSMGFQAVITNSYIIRNDPRLREVAIDEGVHALLDFPGVIMTDSGTFQSHMYGEVGVDNADIVGFQRDIGSDIGTVLDIFSEPHWEREEAERAVHTTLERIQEAVGLKGEMLLAGVVQGSLYPDLREECAREMGSMAVDVQPIGGVVPLMEGYRFSDLVEVIIASKKGLNPARPVHLFGAGHPMTFALAALLGCDMFDSASYAKFAADGRVMSVEGTTHLENMRFLDCQCPACKDHTLESLLRMDERERRDLIARHNLWVSKMEIERVRRAILEGDIWELAERRCRSHPDMLSALRRLKHHASYLEGYEPLSRGRALCYTGPETLSRPSFLRYERRLESFSPMGTHLVMLEDRGKPYGRYHPDAISRGGGRFTLAVNSPFGPVPLELDEIYPLAQSLFPREMDSDCERREVALEKAFARRFEGTVDPQDLPQVDGGEELLDKARVRGVIDYQFGAGVSEAILNGEIVLQKSRTTGKIRTVWVDGEHVLSMRASDGFFTLKKAGARRIMRAFSPPRLRVVVHADSVPFNKEGKNVFCGFVLEADRELVTMDEVMVVDESDDLVALGRAMLIRDEMLVFEKGMAVKVREGIKG
jgi:7-cyano-7-deazaguanine tRNA-ribosyltransferase